MNDFPALPVVIRRSKRFGLVLVVATGLPLGLALRQYLPPPTGAPTTGGAALAGMLPFLLGFLLGILLLLRPARLTLTTEGVTYERLLRRWRRSWRWPEVSGFSWEVVGTGKGKREAIVFTSGLGQVEVPAYWEWPAQEVLDLLNHARTTYGRQPPPAPGIPLAEKRLSAPLPVPPVGADNQNTAQSLPSVTTGFVVWLVALGLIGAGSLAGYWWGYKDSLAIEGGYILLVVFGWLGLLFAATSLLGAATNSKYRPRPVSLLGRLGRRLVQVGYAGAFLVWLGLLVGNLVLVDQQRTQRIARLLASEPTATAIATVTQLRERGTSSGTFRATILSYQAGTEQVTQALPGIGHYGLGQRLRVKYAVAHPDMFVVLE
jgi:hypothetical protein